MLLISDGIGASDCELIRDAWLAQPVNAVSSFAYVVVGAVIVVLAVGERRAVLASSVYGACLAAIGLGSVLFHGPQPGGSQVLHDLPILITALFIVVVDVTLLWPRVGHRWAIFLAASIAATVLTVVDTGLGAAATGAAVAAIVVLEVLVYRCRLRDVPAQRQLLVYGTIIAVAAVAAAAWLLGRTGSPACDPDGDFQFHGLWHLISAALFGVWWWLAFWAAGSQPAARDGADRAT